MRGYFLFDMLQNKVSNTDGAVDTQLAEDFFVFRVIDSSDGPWYTKFMLGYLAGYQVIFILICSCYKHLSPGYPGLGQSSHFATVASDANTSHLIFKVFTLMDIL